MEGRLKSFSRKILWDGGMENRGLEKQSLFLFKEVENDLA